MYPLTCTYNAQMKSMNSVAHVKSDSRYFLKKVQFLRKRRQSSPPEVSRVIFPLTEHHKWL